MNFKYSDLDKSEFHKAVDELVAAFKKIDRTGEYTLNQIMNAHMRRMQQCTADAINQLGRAEGVTAMTGMHQWVEEMIDQLEAYYPGARKEIEAIKQ